MENTPEFRRIALLDAADGCSRLGRAAEQFVDLIVLPRISVFGPLVYLVEVAIGVSLMLGLFSRLGALAGALMAINLWLGLYSAPNEWPWTYFFLVVIQSLFVIEPPGRSLGADALIGGRTGRAAVLRVVGGIG